MDRDTVNDLATCLPGVTASKSATYREIYSANQQRIYCLAFWMTNNELEAEELTANVFHRALRFSAEPEAEAFDRALISALRDSRPLGLLTLSAGKAETVLGVRLNLRRIDLERAVVQLPATELLIFLMHDVEGYDQARIGRLLGLTKKGLHQARLRLRELLAPQV